LDIGASHGWVEAKDTRIVRHVLNPTQQSDRSMEQLGLPAGTTAESLGPTGGACPKARCGRWPL
jgi:hypothetical protein